MQGLFILCAGFGDGGAKAVANGLLQCEQHEQVLAGRVRDEQCQSLGEQVSVGGTAQRVGESLARQAEIEVHQTRNSSALPRHQRTCQQPADHRKGPLGVGAQQDAQGGGLEPLVRVLQAVTQRVHGPIGVEFGQITESFGCTPLIVAPNDLFGQVDELRQPQPGGALPRGNADGQGRCGGRQRFAQRRERPVGGFCRPRGQRPHPVRNGIAFASGLGCLLRLRGGCRQR